MKGGGEVDEGGRGDVVMASAIDLLARYGVLEVDASYRSSVTAR